MTCRPWRMAHERHNILSLVARQWIRGVVFYVEIRLEVNVVPSPFAILVGTVCSSFGPMMLCAALIILFLELVADEDNWFTRPICKRRDDK